MRANIYEQARTFSALCGLNGSEDSITTISTMGRVLKVCYGVDVHYYSELLEGFSKEEIIDDLGQYGTAMQSFMGKKMIFLNDFENQGSMIFTLLHEVGHFLLGHIGTGAMQRAKDDRTTETEADHYATEVLRFNYNTATNERKEGITMSENKISGGYDDMKTALVERKERVKARLEALEAEKKTLSNEFNSLTNLIRLYNSRAYDPVQAEQEITAALLIQKEDRHKKEWWDDKILHALHEIEPKGITKKDLSDKLEVNAKTLGHQVTRLVAEGKVEKIGTVGSNVKYKFIEGALEGFKAPKEEEPQLV